MTIRKQKTFLRKLLKRIEPAACQKEFKPLQGYFNEGNYLRCWQTLLGNINWLENNDCMPLPIEELEYLARNIGIEHKYFGITRECIIKDKKVNGEILLYKVNDDGTRYLRNRYYYHDGIIVGEDIYYHTDGITPEKITVRNKEGLPISTIYFDEKGTFTRHSLR